MPEATTHGRDKTCGHTINRRDRAMEEKRQILPRTTTNIIMPSITIVLLLVALCAGVANAFQLGLQRSVLRQIQTSKFSSKNTRLFAGEEMPEIQEQPNGSGKKDKMISDSMRDRLLRENASLGGDSNQKSGNPILIVAGVVAVLAVASSVIGAI